jgi:hypothetical protein
VLLAEKWLFQAETGPAEGTFICQPEDYLIFLAGRKKPVLKDPEAR